MTVFVPRGFTALNELITEGCAVSEGRPSKALRIGLLNLMPDKKITERQFARVLNYADKDVQLVLLRMGTRVSKKVDVNNFEAIYTAARRDVLDGLDGLIITGAPVEHLEFSQVDYWCELMGILEHLARVNLATLFICWSAQATLHYYYGIQKRPLANKAFGVFPQWKIGVHSPLVVGLGEMFDTPVSRYSTILPLDLLRCSALELIAGSDFTGPGIVVDLQYEFTYMFNHLEYEADTLQCEFQRDVRHGRAANRPVNFGTSGELGNLSECTWSNNAVSFFYNWVDQVRQSPQSRYKQQSYVDFAA